MALFHAASENFEDITVRRCKKVFDCKVKQLRKRIEAATAHYLAHRFSEIIKTIEKQFKGYGRHPDDSLFLNLAIPVANASENKTFDAFERVVHAAWKDRSKIVECNGDLGKVSQHINLASKQHGTNGDCYLYPEVSANVQAYVRSRTAQPGIYLFVDTGAGTVDQSVFIYKDDQGPKLAYLSAEVSPLGSSQIEIRALQKSNGNGDLEVFRRNKEAGQLHADEMKHALVSIAQDLSSPALKALGETYRKGIGTGQIQTIRVIFGGGGHLEDPYSQGVRGGMTEFFALRDSGGGFADGQYIPPFDPDTIPEIGIPIPSDLEFPKNAKASLWFKRLSVAYGLSFPRFDLADYRLPHEIRDGVPLKRGKLVGNEYIEN